MSGPQRLCVTGFLGAGKTRLVEQLRQQGAAEIEELDGLADPALVRRERADMFLICVADAVNLNRLLEDDALAPLVEHQIRCADCVAISRADLVDPAPVAVRIEAMTQAEVLTADQIGLPTRSGSGSAPAPVGDLSDSFRTWRYQGPAVLSPEQAETLLERRPKGIYRLKGRVRVPGGGIELELAGRFRQTRPMADPGETHLVARGPKDRFMVREMDVLFSQLMSDAAFRAGIFNHR